MKPVKLIFILLILGISSVSKAQGYESSETSRNNPLFLIALSSGKEILCIPADLIIMPSEILSLEEIPQKMFLKIYPRKKASSVFKLTPKADIIFLNLNQIMKKFQVPNEAKNYTITISGNKAIDRKNIFASSESISTVEVDDVNKVINILCKPF